jgi:predicted N-formylglutamate amidohydrolase
MMSPQTSAPSELDAPRPLLDADEQPPCSVVNAGGQAPALLVCDHASNVVPRVLNDLGLEPWVLQRHVAYDIGASALTARLAERLDAPAVMAGYSRLVIDLNRSLEDPTSMPEQSDGIEIPGNRGLDAQARGRRVRALFTPYREAIDRELHRRQAEVRAPALIAVHSFTPELQGHQRPWQIGILWDKDPRIPVPLMERLRARHEGLVVGDNLPYSGKHPADYTIDHHGEAAGLPHVSIEVRQDLIDDAAGAERWAGILFEALQPILSDPALYQPWQA